MARPKKLEVPKSTVTKAKTLASSKVIPKKTVTPKLKAKTPARTIANQAPKRETTSKLITTHKTGVAKPKTTKKAVVPKTKKVVPNGKTPSLVNAKPMSAIAPANPSQMLYEPEIIPANDVPMLDEPRSARPTSSSVNKNDVKRDKKADSPHEKGKDTLRDKLRNKRKEKKQEKAAAVTATAAETARSSTPPVNPLVTHPVNETPRPRAVSVPPSALRLRRAWLLRRGLLLLSVFVVLLGIGLLWRANHAPDTATANTKLVAEVGKLAVLPKGETPSITTVVDEAKINQEFLRNAKKGDKVLLYFQSSRAIVYRPTTGQVVNMGPLETPKPRVFIRQGSSTDNISAVKSVVGRTSDFLLASQDQSTKKTYTQTVVIDLTGNRPDLSGRLAQLLHVNVTSLPDGEIPPDADLMVIVGSDYK
jgi:hypothetical protein